MDYLQIESYDLDSKKEFLTIKGVLTSLSDNKETTAFLLYWNSTGNYPVIQMGFNNCFYAIKHNNPKKNNKISLYDILVAIQTPICQITLVKSDIPPVSIYKLIGSSIKKCPFYEMRLTYADSRNLIQTKFPNPYIFPLAIHL